MDSLETYMLQKIMPNEERVLFYSGCFSQKVLIGTVDAIKYEMKQEGTPLALSSKIIITYIEMVQNIIRYSINRMEKSQDDEEYGCGHIVVGKKNPEAYSICSANIVSDLTANVLKEKLDAIRAMSPDELKKAYKAKLRGDVDENSKGAGIGLLEVAKKASQPIEYECTKADGDNSVFFMKVTI